ncbi:MAG TPA: amino acid racemase [Thermomicrobiaceae bacterium]|nr:amino acid racemase [Thermomicrobiaceae bacterium]
MTDGRTVGVLGGMGPLATADLYRKIIDATPARRDQDHLHVIIDADPRVPDRTDALLRGGEDPTPWLVAGACRLAAAGADFIVMPCNTAHAFLPQVQLEVTIPFVSMIEAATAEVARIVAPGSPVGILATSGTIAVGLYQHALERLGLRPLVPADTDQVRVETGIHLVKAGQTGREATEHVLVGARSLVAHGAVALLAACTELPIILHQEDVPVPLVDPTAALARAAVAVASEDEAIRQFGLNEGMRHAVQS